MSLLAIDVGNTRIKWALYSHAQPDAKLLASGAEFLENIEHLAEGPWAQLGQFPTPQHMIGCIVAGDAVRQRVQEQIEGNWDLHPQWVLSSPQEAGLVNGYDHPLRLGADRWVAMIGAWHRMLAAHGASPKPIVVTMVGTAVTVEAIGVQAAAHGGVQGKFLGGFILPGHGIMLKALESGTAGLHVPTGDVKEFPTNTSDALTSGGTYAIAGAVRRMRHHVQNRCGQDPVLFMTGGAGWKMHPWLGLDDVELADNLILEGLLEVAKFRGLVVPAL
ncbi:MAG: type III pantothenate kinase [Brachymonas sp.]